MSYPISQPYSVFADIDGQPLENGYIYIGTANLDAQANPITVYWDAAGTIAASQPIRTLSGYPVWNGTAANIYVSASDCSIKILNKNGTLVTSKPTSRDQEFANNMIFVQSGTGAVARTVQSKLRDVVSVKDFGAKGDGSTNDTAAIQAAINYVESIVPFGSVPTQTGNVRRNPAIYIPAGAYIITNTLQISQQSIWIYGDGVEESVLVLNSNTNIVAINMGTFNANPPDVFVTGTQDCHFSDFGIFNNYWGYPASSSQGTAIQNNGSGGLHLSNIQILGFAVGVNCPYGGDYNQYDNVNITSCNIAMYQGPGGQQTQVNKLTIGDCTYGVVLDRPAHIEFNMPVINNCKENAVLIEAPSNTTTRYLASFGTGGTSLQSKIVFNTAWLEGNAGGYGDIAIPTHFFYINAQTTEAYRDIEINNPYVVAGDTVTKTTTSLVGQANTGPNAKRVYINTPVVQGGIQYWVYNPGLSWVLNNPRITNGFDRPIFRNTSVSVPIADAVYQKIRTSLPSTSSVLNHIGANGIVTETGSNYLRYAFQNSNAVFTGSLDSSGNLTVTAVSSGSIAIGQTLTFDGAFEEVGTITGGSGSSWTVSGINGVVSSRTMYTYTRLYRMGMDVENRRFFLGDPSSSEFSISRAASVPTSGTYAAGSFVFNTAPSVAAGKTLLGWQRLTTGSGHVVGTDWSLCYVTDS